MVEYCVSSAKVKKTHPTDKMHSSNVPELMHTCKHEYKCIYLTIFSIKHTYSTYILHVHE